MDDIKCFSIGAMNSEGMLSKNPLAGYHETTIARTLDTSGSNPAAYQGGDIIVYLTRGTETNSSGEYRQSTVNVCFF